MLIQSYVANLFALINDPVFFDTHTHRFLKEIDDLNYHHHHHYSTNSFILQGELTLYRDFHYGEYHADNVDEFIPCSSFKVYEERNIIDIGQHIHEPYSPFMAGLCNGLVCLSSNGPYCNGPGYTTYGGRFYVCNPVTREYLDIPIQEYTFHKVSSFAMATGFGYHTSTKEYKIVRVAYANDEARGSMVHVYTLGSGKWRSKGEINHLLGEINHSLPKEGMDRYDVSNSIGVFLTGALYWLNEKMEIVSFDLGDKEFRIVPVTQPSSFNIQTDDQHGVLGGCLCLAQHEHNTEITKIWVMMMNKDKEEYSWIEKFKIKWKSRPYWFNMSFALLSNGSILLHSKDCNYIASYDPKTGHFTPRSNKGFEDLGYNRIFPYVKSFVSLKALQEKDAMARILNAEE